MVPWPCVCIFILDAAGESKTCFVMLYYQQTKALEQPLGPDKAGPATHTLETTADHVEESIVQEQLIREHLHRRAAELETRITPWRLRSLCA